MVITTLDNIHNLQYRSGTFDGDFNLVVWRICLKNRQTKVTANTIFRWHCEVSYGNPWLFRQTKCSPICVCCLIAKLNVHQMYLLYGIK